MADALMMQGVASKLAASVGLLQRVVLLHAIHWVLMVLPLPHPSFWFVVVLPHVCV